MYAKLNNGIIQYAPKNFMADNGQYITNFNNNEVLMKRFGFKEILDVRPAYNSETQRLHQKGYSENEENIIVHYEIIDIEVVEPQPTLEERVTALENEIGNMSTMLIQTLELNNDDLM